MIDISRIDITRTLIYQDARQQGMQQGIQEGEKSLILRLLSKRFGKVQAALRKKLTRYR
jgi:hypothetical protein